MNNNINSYYETKSNFNRHNNNNNDSLYKSHHYNDGYDSLNEFNSLLSKKISSIIASSSISSISSSRHLDSPMLPTAPPTSGFNFNNYHYQ